MPTTATSFSTHAVHPRSFFLISIALPGLLTRPGSERRLRAPGNEYNALVEFSPYQGVAKRDPVDKLVGTYEQGASSALCAHTPLNARR